MYRNLYTYIIDTVYENINLSAKKLLTKLKYLDLVQLTVKYSSQRYVPDKSMNFTGCERPNDGTYRMGPY